MVLNHLNLFSKIMEDKIKKTKATTRIGDLFCVEFSDNTKGFFQYVTRDAEYLNGQVIRVFKKHYPIDADIAIDDILADDVDFYAYTILKAGIHFNTWYKIGNSKNVDEDGFRKVIFGQTNDTIDDTSSSYKFAEIEVDPLTNWFIWRINEKWIPIGILPDEYHDVVELGGITPHLWIKDRMKRGYYPITKNAYEILKRIPRPEYKSYIKDMSGGNEIYICFKGNFFESAVLPVNGKMTKVSRDEAVLNGMDIVRKKFSDTNWKAQNFITEEEFNKVWDSIE